VRLQDTLLQLWRATTPRPARSARLRDEAFLRRLERLALALHRPPTSGLAGDHRSRRRSDAPEFADYRTYSPGDDFRRIDWKAYARLNALYYRQGEAQDEVTLYLLVDTSLSMDWGEPNKLDYARQLAGALGYLSLARLDAVGVSTLDPRGPRLEPLRGKGQASRLFGYLDDLTPSAPPSSVVVTLGEALRAWRRTARRGVVVLLTDALFPEDEPRGPLGDELPQRCAAPLGELAGAGFEPVLLHLLSPQELAPELAGDLELVDRESGELVPVSLTPETLARYQARLEAWCRELERYCGARRIAYVRLSTALPLEEAVLGELRRRGLIV
jgi:uncharacterized protein (DUF58 family)